MSTSTSVRFSNGQPVQAPVKNKYASVLELLKGVLVIIMTLGYIHDYFHYDAFMNNSTDTGKPGIGFLFTNWTIQYCTPVFVFLTGISAFLSGDGKPGQDFSNYLLRRGVLFVFAELFINTLGNGFNPSYPIFNLQALWITGISMMVLSALVFMGRRAILLTGIMLIILYNLFSAYHPVEYHYRAFLEYPNEFAIGHFTFLIHAPLLPCIGMIAIGYYFGNLFVPGFHPEIRKTTLFFVGAGAVAIFLALRVSDPSGGTDQWSVQKNAALGILFFLDVTEHPSSILYALITIGPAMIFLARFEKPLSRLTQKIAVFGRLPLFYFVILICLLHVFAVTSEWIAGYVFPGMTSAGNFDPVPVLKLYDFEISNVYFLWIGFVILLYPCCKWFDCYKHTHHCTHRWLCYL